MLSVWGCLALSCISDISQSNQNHASHLYSNDMSQHVRLEEAPITGDTMLLSNEMRDYQNMKALIFDINLLALLTASNPIGRKGHISYIVSINILYGRNP